MPSKREAQKRHDEYYVGQGVVNDPQLDADTQGATMIVALQKLVGIEESVESAKKGWKSLDDTDKEATVLAYRLFCQPQ